MHPSHWRFALQLLSLREEPETHATLPSVASKRIRSFREAHRPWLKQNGITGFAIGRKQTKGKRTRRPCVIVYVQRKHDPDEISRHPIPARVRLPKLGWVETDVQEMPRLKAQAFQGVQRPLQPGCSIGFNLRTAGPGSLGCLARSTRPGEEALRLLLSCEHVLCNDLRQREKILGPGGTMSRVIEQPAPLYQPAAPTDFRIGLVHRSGNIRFGGYANRIDAAVAWITAAVPANNTPLGGLGSITKTGPIYENQRVMKVGSSTGVQIGYISAATATLNVEYVPETAGGTSRSAKFTDVATYQCACLPGDSGAPVLDANSLALIGLHFAGEGNFAVLCPITTVLAALNVTLA